MDYLLVLPNGRAIGFLELEGAKAALNMYHEGRINMSKDKEVYSIYDMFEEKSREDLSYIIGAEEGEGKIYDVESLIENIQRGELLDEEKEEIIRLLLAEGVNFDISDYGIEDLLAETKVY
ncbi:MAG: hypothetical protein ACRDAU_08790 [Clostridium sp.]